jgi:hypothetical protein
MTDQKPDDGSAVKPQVIDLEAEDITPDRAKRDEAEPHMETGTSGEAETVPPRPSSPVRHSSRTTLPWIALALVLGLIAGGWLYRDVLAAYLPPNQMLVMQQRLDALEARNKTLNDQLAAVAQASDVSGQSVSGLVEKLKSFEASNAGQTKRIESVEALAAAAEDGVKKAEANIASLRKSISSIGTTSSGNGGPVDNAALVALGQRIDTLEKDVASLKANSGEGSKASITAALSQALADLKAKVAAGAPYSAEYDRLSRMVPAAAGLEVLGAHAQAGIPSPQGLAAELRAAIPALPKPSEPAPAGDSYWDTLLSSLSGIVTIRNIGEADWPQVAEKAAALADSGDIEQAIAVIGAAEGTKPQALSQWSDKAAARLKLEAAASEVGEAVIRQITALEQAK